MELASLTCRKSTATQVKKILMRKVGSLSLQSRFLGESNLAPPSEKGRHSLTSQDSWGV